MHLCTAVCSLSRNKCRWCISGESIRRRSLNDRPWIIERPTREWNDSIVNGIVILEVVRGSFTGYDVLHSIGRGPSEITTFAVGEARTDNIAFKTSLCKLFIVSIHLFGSFVRNFFLSTLALQPVPILSLKPRQSCSNYLQSLGKVFVRM